jgi:hypothetical protein
MKQRLTRLAGRCGCSLYTQINRRRFVCCFTCSNSSYNLDLISSGHLQLYKEVKEILGDRDPTYDDYEQLVYSKCVFKESLRLFPQVVGIPKMAARDTTLGPYRIPKDVCLPAISSN